MPPPATAQVLPPRPLAPKIRRAVPPTQLPPPPPARAAEPAREPRQPAARTDTAPEEPPPEEEDPDAVRAAQEAKGQVLELMHRARDGGT